MRYMGGKFRLAKHITPFINQFLKGRDYYEPFVGANNITPHLKDYKNCWLTDANEWVIAYHIQRKKGWTPYSEFNENDEKKIKEIYKLCKDETNKKAKSGYSKGFIGHMVHHCSFGGKHNGGFVFSKGFIGHMVHQCSFGGDLNGGFINNNPKYNSKHDYFKLRKVDYKENWFFATTDYKEITPKNAVIYMDPPYDGTTKYRFTIEHKDFWEHVRRLSKDNFVYVSEQNAPDDFVVLFEKEQIRTLNAINKGHFKATEKLFTYKNGLVADKMNLNKEKDIMDLI